MKSYKYMKSEHAARMITLGQVRIGTLYNYRQVEHANGIRDEYEGQKDLSGIINGKFARSSEIPDVSAKLLGLNFKGESTNIEIINAKFEHTLVVENAYIYCTCNTLDIDLYKEFGDSDTCVEITDLNQFTNILTDYMFNKLQSKYIGTDHVTYQDRKEEWNGIDMGIDPSFIKSLKYSNQHEIRSVWRPIYENKINYQIITIPELTKYVKIIDKRT